ncbi:thiol-disulfide isomerase/thioredoxin [Bradyrhizobium yuanmingense]|uniref:TlpA family protein disulfide reductase n=1 Tax=Bradyrhizobium yuanmingense TaxID=108015 RepID=UPI0035976327
MVLGLESPAPPIKVENWLRGEPLSSFQPGKVYIVEFWATWCGPCVAAVPELVQLQEKYKKAALRSSDSRLLNALKQRTRPETSWTPG